MGHAGECDRPSFAWLRTEQSLGCIRIPGSTNEFIDRYGVLDLDHEQAMAAGKSFWVLQPDRTPMPWSGRYRVVADSSPPTRPA
jgi:hypothetical protein